MRFSFASLVLAGAVVTAGGCTDVPGSPDGVETPEPTEPGADITPETLEFSTENEDAPARPVSPNNVPPGQPSRYGELEDQPTQNAPQFDATPTDGLQGLSEPPRADDAPDGLPAPSEGLSPPPDPANPDPMN